MANAPFMRHHFCTAADSVDIIAQRKNSVNKKAKGRPFLCLPSAGFLLNYNNDDYFLSDACAKAKKSPKPEARRI
jgi:hypothetical protein